MTWNTRVKPTYKNYYLLQENGDYLLQENGDKIYLTVGEIWGDRTKPTSDAWNTRTKPN